MPPRNMDTATRTLGFEPCIAPELLLEQPTAMAPDMMLQPPNTAPFSLQNVDMNILQLPPIDWAQVNPQCRGPTPAIDPRLVNESAEPSTAASERKNTRHKSSRRDTISSGSSSGESKDNSRRKKRGSNASDTTTSAGGGRRRSSGSGARLSPEVQMAGTRERNRIAASKYRKKHGESISRLQEDEKHARDQHKALAVCVDALRFEVLGLKNELLRHGDCDCDEIKGYLKREAVAIGRGYKENMAG